MHNHIDDNKKLQQLTEKQNIQQQPHNNALNPLSSQTEKVKTVKKKLGIKSLNSKPKLFVAGVIAIILLLFAYVITNKNNAIPTSFENKQAENASSHAQNITRDGTKQSNAAKLAAKKHQDNLNAINQAKQEQELKQKQQTNLLDLVTKLTKELKDITDIDQIKQILEKYGITDPKLIAQITKRIKNNENLDDLLADTLKQQKITNLADQDIAQQILERIKNNEQLEDILNNLGITDPKLKAEILDRFVNGEKLKDIFSDINKRIQIGQRITNGEQIKDVLAQYGITDPDLIAEIEKKFKAGEPIDAILAGVLKDKYLIDTKNPQVTKQLTKLNDKAVQKQIADRLAKGDKLEDILNDLGITDKSIQAEIQRRLNNSEKIEDILQNLGSLAPNNANGLTAIEQAEIKRRLDNGESMESVLADITKRKQLAKLNDKDIQQQIADRLAKGDKIADILNNLGITDKSIQAEIQRRLNNGEKIESILQSLNLPINGKGQTTNQLPVNPDNLLGSNIPDIPTSEIPISSNNSDLDTEERKALRDTMRQRKMQIFEQALTAKSIVDFEAQTINSSSDGSSIVANSPMQPTNADDELAQVRQQINQQNIEIKQSQQLLKQAQELQEQMNSDAENGFMPMSYIEDDGNSSNLNNSVQNKTNQSAEYEFSNNEDNVDYAINKNPSNSNNSYNSNGDGFGLQKTNFTQIQISNNAGSFVKASNLGNSSSAQQQTSQKPSRWDLGNTLQDPASKYVIQAGWTIPATLISGINSDLPGQIIGQVSQNVYDNATGKYLLIPQGSRLVGQFAGGVLFGQERVLIAWQRIVFPDGRNLDIGEMAGTDSAGFSGFKDQVNNHYWKTFGNAFLMGGVITTITISQNKKDDNSNNQRASDALSEALGQQIGQVATQMIQKNMNVSPTIEIRPGYRFNIMISKDLVFPSTYKKFD